MKHIIVVALAMAAGWSAAAGQDLRSTYPAHGYAYFGGAAFRGGGSGLAVGAGADIFAWRGIAGGFDVGWMFPASEFNSGIGVLALGPSYHFVSPGRPRRVVPFVTGGWGLAFRSGSLSMLQYGGGATIWMNDKIGLRLEVRDHRTREYGHYFTAFRASVAFR